MSAAKMLSAVAATIIVAHAAVGAWYAYAHIYKKGVNSKTVLDFGTLRGGESRTLRTSLDYIEPSFKDVRVLKTTCSCIKASIEKDDATGRCVVVATMKGFPGDAKIAPKIIIGWREGATRKRMDLMCVATVTPVYRVFCQPAEIQVWEGDVKDGDVEVRDFTLIEEFPSVGSATEIQQSETQVSIAESDPAFGRPEDVVVWKAGVPRLVVHGKNVLSRRTSLALKISPRFKAGPRRRRMRLRCWNGHVKQVGEVEVFITMIGTTSGG